MKIRNVLILMLVVLGAVGCDLEPGSKYDQRFSVVSWDAIDEGECLQVGAYTMNLNVFSTPFQSKVQVKLNTYLKDDRDFLPGLLTLRYTQTRGLATIDTYSIPLELKNGKGKYQQFFSGLNIQAGDDIAVEACADGQEGDTIPTMTHFDLRWSWKFDKLQSS